MLNIPEYSDYVRGKGYGVTPTNFYLHAKNKNPSTAQVMNFFLQDLISQIHELQKNKKK